jgi:hypothetical protein
VQLNFYAEKHFLGSSRNSFSSSTKAENQMPARYFRRNLLSLVLFRFGYGSCFVKQFGGAFLQTFDFLDKNQKLSAATS